MQQQSSFARAKRRVKWVNDGGLSQRQQQREQQRQRGFFRHTHGRCARLAPSGAPDFVMHPAVFAVCSVSWEFTPLQTWLSWKSAIPWALDQLQDCGGGGA